ncbi:MAG TPA: phosphoribosyltransferase [Blastocatellia bacterium]|nr:phosphoribosyltransferase [Blastocatellia bacterium]
MTIRFKDRAEAGRLLAQKLQNFADKPDVLVLALPRGGVPVAAEIAHALGARIDVFIVRKLGTPGQKELAMGAIATGGVRVLNNDVIRLLRIREEEIAKVAVEEQRETESRERLYRGARPAPVVKDQTVILVDDGLATGSTMHAAVAALRQQQPARIVVAIPVAPPSTLREFAGEADDIVCVLTPDEPFDGVGRWYLDFSQTTDNQVRGLLDRAESERAKSAPGVADEKDWAPWRFPTWHHR